MAFPMNWVRDDFLVLEYFSDSVLGKGNIKIFNNQFCMSINSSGWMVALALSSVYRIDVFKLWCWRRLESPFISKEIKPVNPKEINPEYSLEGMMPKL